MRLGIDIGGTFTDFVLFDVETGVIHTYKVLSTPQEPAAAVLKGMQSLLVGQAAEIVHGSTVATNALLEKKGARTALITTSGFRDVLAIGRQVRTELYDFFADRPEPLVPQSLRLEVDERVDHRGEVLQALNQGDIPPLIARLQELEVESVAISLLFSFLNRKHEKALAKALREQGFFVSPSSEILPEFREFERTSTTVINAYVAPIVERYLEELQQKLDVQSFHIMQSNGGLLRAEEARGEAVHTILSGPAGGVVGARYAAQLAGFDHFIGFDMGGTSTDVSLSDGELRTTTEAQVGGYPLRIPVIDIHTVGSGGGSIAVVDPGGALRVGPQSAGADPGPVCYGLDGDEPTVTDADLILGRLAPDFFLGGTMPLYPGVAEKAMANLARDMDLGPAEGLTAAQRAALGVIEVVNAHMERALRVISVERGYDPEDFILVSFGGAGGIHAVELARGLGIPRVLIPSGASTLSAFGMLAADAVKDYVQTVMIPGTVTYRELDKRFSPMETQAGADLVQQGIPEGVIQIQRELDVRYIGEGYELSVPFTPEFLLEFHRLHQSRYGHRSPHLPVEIVNLRLRAVGSVPRPQLPRRLAGNAEAGTAILDRRPVALGEKRVETVPFYLGDRLRSGQVLHGPSMVLYKDTTVFLPDGCRGAVDDYGSLMVEVGRV